MLTTYRYVEECHTPSHHASVAFKLVYPRGVYTAADSPGLLTICRCTPYTVGCMALGASLVFAPFEVAGLMPILVLLVIAPPKQAMSYRLCRY